MRKPFRDDLFSNFEFLSASAKIIQAHYNLYEYCSGLTHASSSRTSAGYRVHQALSRYAHQVYASSTPLCSRRRVRSAAPSNPARITSKNTSLHRCESPPNTRALPYVAAHCIGSCLPGDKCDSPTLNAVKSSESVGSPYHLDGLNMCGSSK